MSLSSVKIVKTGDFNVNKAPLTLTPKAFEKVKDLINKEKKAIGLIIGVKERGCSGLSYVLDYCYKDDPKAVKVELNGSNIFIDSKAQLTLLGAEMDYVESRLSSGFVFNNPNIKGTCGCGESFHV